MRSTIIHYVNSINKEDTHCGRYYAPNVNTTDDIEKVTCSYCKKRCVNLNYVSDNDIINFFNTNHHNNDSSIAKYFKIKTSRVSNVIDTYLKGKQNSMQ